MMQNIFLCDVLSDNDIVPTETFRTELKCINYCSVEFILLFVFREDLLSPEILLL